MRYIYLYVLDTMADWEVGHAIAELCSQPYFAEPKDWSVHAVAPTNRPVRTMGGVTIRPDMSVDEVSHDGMVLLILPGADTWLTSDHSRVLQLARDCLAAHVPVAAICGATAALAEVGMLDRVLHTSSSLEYLRMTCPHYRGAAYYRNELAVTDGALVTAGSSAQVEFACHILRLLSALRPDHLERWYGYFARHSVPDLLALLDTLKR